MFNMIIAGFFMIFSMNMFFSNFSYMGVYRAYLGMYKGVADLSVQVYFSDGVPLEKPMFHCEKFEENVHQYLKESLKKYVKNYSVNFDYQNINFIHGVKMAEKAKASFNTKILGFGEKRYVASFVISRSPFYGE